MKKSIMKKWVAALRSGEYKQTTRKLRGDTFSGKNDGFCCLGVLCNIHAQENPDHAKKERDPRRYMGELGGLSAGMREWSGMKSRLGAIPVKIQQAEITGVTLADCNDSHAWGFSRIADFVEKHYKVL